MFADKLIMKAILKILLLLLLVWTRQRVETSSRDYDYDPISIEYPAASTIGNNLLGLDEEGLFIGAESFDFNNRNSGMGSLNSTICSEPRNAYSIYGSGDEDCVDYCGPSPCAVEATCTNEEDSASCACNVGFRGEPFVLCEPFCFGETLEINGASYTFQDTWSNQFAYSDEVCPYSGVVILDCSNTIIKEVKRVQSIEKFTENVFETFTENIRLLTAGEGTTINTNESQAILDVFQQAIEEEIKVTLNAWLNVIAVESQLIRFVQGHSNEGDPTSRNIIEDISLEVLYSIKALSSSVTLSAYESKLAVETNELAGTIYNTNSNLRSVLDGDKNSSTASSFTGAVITHRPNSSATEKAASFFIPAEAFQQSMKKNNVSGEQFFVIYYKQASLFPSNLNVTNPLSISFGNDTAITSLTERVRIELTNQKFKHSKEDIPNNTLLIERTQLGCRFWDETSNDWSPEGCCLNQTAFPPVCQCNHLTNFALLVAIDVVPKDVVLAVTSDVGCILSVIGLAITFLLHVASKERRQYDTIQIFLNVCGNLFVAYLLFVIGIGWTNNREACDIITALLQFVFLTTWCWMTAYGFQIYLKLVKIFSNIGGERIMTIFYVLCYGVPAIITTLNAGITLGYLEAQNAPVTCDRVNKLSSSSYRADNMCWLKGYSLYFGFLLPVGIMLVSNVVFFVLVIRNVVWKKKKISSSKRRIKTRQNLSISMTLFTTMGIVWVVGFFMLLSTDPTYLVVLSWIFSIFTTLQGFLIFAMSCLRKTQVRDEWVETVRSLCG